MTHITNRQGRALAALLSGPMVIADMRSAIGLCGRESAYTTMYALRQRRWVEFFEDPAAQPGQRFSYRLTPLGKAHALMHPSAVV